MDKAIKKKWLKALRSGEYEQGKGQLRDENEFCCLGVLGDIQGIKWGKKYKYGFAAELADLPKYYASGLSSDQQLKLANLNDGGWGKKKRSFLQIANYIEKHL